MFSLASTPIAYARSYPFAANCQNEAGGLALPETRPPPVPPTFPGAAPPAAGPAPPVAALLLPPAPAVAAVPFAPPGCAPAEPLPPAAGAAPPVPETTAPPSGARASPQSTVDAPHSPKMKDAATYPVRRFMGSAPLASCPAGPQACGHTQRRRGG